MNCIVCKKPLENIDPFENGENQPSGGTAFQTHGHYGSTVFDPMDGTYLEINVCDACLTQAGTDGNILMGFPAAPAPRAPLVQWSMTDVETEI